MHIDRFANYLLALLLGLQLAGYFLIFFFWVKFGSIGILVGSVLTAGISVGALYSMAKTPVYNDNGEKQSIDQVLADVITIVVVLSIMTLLLTLKMMFVGYKLAKTHERSKAVGTFLPFLATGILYGSMFVATKI